MMPTNTQMTALAARWFPHTATIDWCEPNYAYSPYIVEWWNTWSNLAYIVPACHILRGAGAGGAARWPARLLLLIGTSSAAFHGTLQLHAQLVDEVAMNLFAATLHAQLSPAPPGGGVSRAALFPLLFAVAHVYWRFTTLFQLQFLATVLQIAYVLHVQRGVGWRQSAYLFTPAALGFAFWCADYLLCASLGHWGGHGAWHVLTALSGWRIIGFVRDGATLAHRC